MQSILLYICLPFCCGNSTAGRFTIHHFKLEPTVSKFPHLVVFCSEFSYQHTYALKLNWFHTGKVYSFNIFLLVESGCIYLHYNTYLCILQYYIILHSNVWYCITAPHYPLMEESNILNKIYVQQGTQRMYSGVTTGYTTARRL